MIKIYKKFIFLVDKKKSAFPKKNLVKNKTINFSQLTRL